MRSKAIKGPGHDQFFHYPTVDLFGVGTGAEIKQLAEITAFVTGVDDRFDRAFTDAFDRADTVNDLARVINMELIETGVDIRRQDFQSHPPALIDQANHFLGVIHIGGHDRSHKLSRIVRFQPQRLVGDECVGRRV